MSAPYRLMVAALAIVMVSACSANRAGVKDLSDAQQSYYQDLSGLLADGELRLRAGLEIQAKLNNGRRAELVEWSRDLERAEVLLQVDSNVTGNKRLLSYQLAQLDLQRINAMRIRDETSARHVELIMELHQRVQDAVSKLRENNEIMTKYLGSGDAAFVVRSIDLDGIVAAVAGIQATREQLDKIEARSEEERAEEREHVQKSVERARETLLRVFDLRR